MITLHDLDTAIAKYQGLADPKPADAIKLAAFYIIRNEMFSDEKQSGSDQRSPYSFAGPPEQVETTIDYYSDTEFSQAVNGRRAEDVWPVLDELMSVLQATNPRLYAGVMRKIED